MTEASQPTESVGRTVRRQAGIQQLLAMVSPAGPWVVRVAATLCLADHVAGGTCRLAELAAKTETDPDALGRLLRFLTTRGIFVEAEPDTFALNAAARMLLDQHPSRLRSWLDLSGAGGRMDASWCGLLDCVRSGKPVYEALNGRNFWDDLAQHSELSQSFAALMAINIDESTRDVLDAREFGDVRHVMDVGGGSGSLLAAVLCSNPHLRGTLVELAQCAPAARSRFAALGLDERARVVAGSFFDELPRGADLVILANVLHDWDDERSLRILGRCAEALEPGGKLLIVERMSDAAGRTDTSEEDLRYLLLFGGRARSVAQFARLSDCVMLRALDFRLGASGLGLLSLAKR